LSILSQDRNLFIISGLLWDRIFATIFILSQRIYFIFFSFRLWDRMDRIILGNWKRKVFEDFCERIFVINDCSFPVRVHVSRQPVSSETDGFNLPSAEGGRVLEFTLFR